MTTGFTVFRVIMVGERGACAAAASPAVPVTTNSRRDIFSVMETPLSSPVGTWEIAVADCKVLLFHATCDFDRDHPRGRPIRVRRGGADPAGAARPAGLRRTRHLPQARDPPAH